MKITGFCPLIVTRDAAAAVKVFEDLGFRKYHTKTDIEAGRNISYALKDSNGNRINITSSETIQKDLTGISVNVDHFQEAYDFLIARGFFNPRGDRITDTDSSIATLLFSPSGFAVSISEHIRRGE